MKGLSVILTMVLLVLAHWLSQYLKKTGSLPAETAPQRGLVGVTPEASLTRSAASVSATLAL